MTEFTRNRVPGFVLRFKALAASRRDPLSEPPADAPELVLHLMVKRQATGLEPIDQELPPIVIHLADAAAMPAAILAAIDTRAPEASHTARELIAEYLASAERQSADRH